MRDDYLSPAWASEHRHFSEAVHRAVARGWRLTLIAFEHLNRRQFDAPWRTRRQRELA